MANNHPRRPGHAADWPRLQYVRACPLAMGRWADRRSAPVVFRVGRKQSRRVDADPPPTYTPPEPVKRCYVSGDSEDIALVFEAVNSRIDTSGSWTHQAELRDLSRRLWKTNIDPDAAIRLRELASEVVRKHDAETLGGSGDSRAINELREAAK